MTYDTTPGSDRDAEPGTEPAASGEEQLVEDGLLDGTPETPDPREEAQLQAQLEREIRFDGFEQGIEG
ncbi:hypothetical protein [Microbacterium sp. SORGH_AS_0862]|uniref:hypothetical protein n=1 Tax=Microbacterium sp. SORGH_AS_0862 TaxID=3041789 RepID=UPI0027942F4F|nr:hypothetical protein [Microbacterium sp. SORGH_AS_0862]MDQ1204034.1 hypothetical protein [Microbacterium sp. SORGH_AS_0862]